MEDAIPKLDSEGQGSVFDNMFYHRLFLPLTVLLI